MEYAETVFMFLTNQQTEPKLPEINTENDEAESEKEEEAVGKYQKDSGPKYQEINVLEDEIEGKIEDIEKIVHQKEEEESQQNHQQNSQTQPTKSK